MFQLRRTFRVPGWRAGHWHRSRSFQQVMAPPVQEQTDSLRLPGWRALEMALETERTFAPRFSLPNTSRPKVKLQANGKSWYVLDSSFSPQRFVPQHCLHNPDLSALAAINIGREIEQFSVLPGARGVEQVLHHNQRPAVVLNHPRQK